ncbi:MAG TPA: hypothetical protein VHE11_10955 [Steroidobacteraceae bacterium]|nr:hypothetical protein [Steroidobacteraceae bacterium]
MRLIDSVAQCHTPFVVRNGTGGQLTALNNTADCAALVERCPLRYVLSDDLTRLCVDLAYSKGARAVACADLLHMPAEMLWLEWSNTPWKDALQQYGLRLDPARARWVGRRGAWIRATRDGRRGVVRTFWSVGGEDVFASSVEAYFDFDTAIGEEPEPVDGKEGLAGRVFDNERSEEDILGRCFRFRYEQSWSEYYGNAGLSGKLRLALWRHALGTIAMDIPMLLAFLLLLATRTGLPQRPQTFERLNLRRLQRGKPPLLDHIEVRAPLLPEYREHRRGEPEATRRSPRLHHVRGHLVRRGSQIFWRVPHLRGNARSGAVRTRTVVWTFDGPRARAAMVATPAAGRAH